MSVEELYNQCQRAYERYRDNSSVTYDGMPIPNVFDESFNAPAEFLFREICKHNKSWVAQYQLFIDRLIKWLFDKRQFDLKEFSALDARNKPYSQYCVYFEVYYRKENSHSWPPFRGELKINTTTFRWISKRELQNADVQYIQSENQRRSESNHPLHDLAPNKYIEDRTSRVNKQPYFRERYCHPIVATIYAVNNHEAVNQVIQDFELFTNCVNCAQVIGIRRAGAFLGSDIKPKLENRISDIGVYTVIGGSGAERFLSDAPLQLPQQTFKSSKNRRRLQQRLCAASQGKSPVSDRIRDVVGDLSLAYNTKDVGIRRLSFWRCLEHATRKQDGPSRKEKEIIQIIGNYYREPMWKQIGKLIKDARNSYVHRGIIKGEGRQNQYTNWFQQYAEAALRILLYLSKNKDYWNNKSKVDEFFDHYAKSNQSLELAAKILTDRSYGK